MRQIGKGGTAREDVLEDLGGELLRFEAAVANADCFNVGGREGVETMAWLAGGESARKFGWGVEDGPEGNAAG